jgi:hypothetical protein
MGHLVVVAALLLARAHSAAEATDAIVPSRLRVLSHPPCDRDSGFAPDETPLTLTLMLKQRNLEHLKERHPSDCVAGLAC